MLAAIAVLLVIALRWFSGEPSAETPHDGYVAGELKPGIYEVDRVIDGDTLLLKDKQVRVRLQGVDTPETVKEDTPVQPWGPEASAYTKAFVREAGDRVRVEIDGEPLDQHGRYLAFVWHGERLLNEELVRNGLARATLQYDFGQKKKDLLRRAQQQAQRESLGKWSR
jgi:micrococcal nuclease